MFYVNNAVTLQTIWFVKITTEAIEASSYLEFREVIGRASHIKTDSTEISPHW